MTDETPLNWAIRILTDEPISEHQKDWIKEEILAQANKILNSKLSLDIGYSVEEFEV